jgi:hypothetical protein
MAVSRILGGAEIRCCDFSAVIAVARTADFVFVLASAGIADRMLRPCGRRQ